MGYQPFYPSPLADIALNKANDELVSTQELKEEHIEDAFFSLNEELTGEPNKGDELEKCGIHLYRDFVKLSFFVMGANPIG